MSVSFCSVVCCQVEVSASGRSLVQRSPTECGVSECDLETSTMRRRRPTRAVELSSHEKISVLHTLPLYCLSVFCERAAIKIQCNKIIRFSRRDIFSDCIGRLRTRIETIGH
jgi:hypothetical protein